MKHMLVVLVVVGLIGCQFHFEAAAEEGLEEAAADFLAGIKKPTRLVLEQAEKMGGCEKNHSKCLEISVLWVLKRSVEHLSRRHFE